jgi:hypothetical protein
MLRLFDKRLLGILLIACAVAACDDTVPPVTPTPTDPVTETFAGTIGANGAATHSFSVSAGGAVTATLKAIGTDNTLEVSLALGNWSADACSIVLANDKATGGFVLGPRTMTGAGTLCARVADIGNIPAGQTAAYTIEVVHP